MTDYRKLSVNIFKYLTKKGWVIAILGAICILAAICVFLLMSFTRNFPDCFLNISFVLSYLGVVLAVLGILFITTQKLTENLWGNLFLFIVVFMIMLGFLIVGTNELDQQDMQTILNTCITIDFAILALAFAGLTIGDKFKEIFTDKNNVLLFKTLIFVTSFSLLFTTIIYFFSFFDMLNVINLNLLSLSIPIRGFNFILWGITTLTILSISNMIFFIFRILKKQLQINEEVPLFWEI